MWRVWDRRVWRSWPSGPSSVFPWKASIVISFFVKQRGRLSGGETLEEAISKVDTATGSAPAYYMINCTHPTEFEPALTSGDWTLRLGGFMPNAVAMDTLSLCKLGHIEDGDPEELGG